MRIGFSGTSPIRSCDDWMVERVDAVADVDDRCPSCLGRRPRDWCVERPVDLHRAPIPFEPPDVRGDGCRDVVSVEQAQVEPRRVDGCDHGPPSCYLPAVGCPHADRSPATHGDVFDGGVALDRAGSAALRAPLPLLLNGNTATGIV
jgi:hypothetical protein